MVNTYKYWSIHLLPNGYFSTLSQEDLSKIQAAPVFGHGYIAFFSREKKNSKISRPDPRLDGLGYLIGSMGPVEK